MCGMVVVGDNGGRFFAQIGSHLPHLGAPEVSPGPEIVWRHDSYVINSAEPVLPCVSQVQGGTRKKKRAAQVPVPVTSVPRGLFPYYPRAFHPSPCQLLHLYLVLTAFSSKVVPSPVPPSLPKPGSVSARTESVRTVQLGGMTHRWV